MQRIFSMVRSLRIIVCAAFFLTALPARAEPQRAPAGGGSILRELNGALSHLATRVSPAVVQILVSGYAPVSSEENRAAAALSTRQRVVGSGVIVDPSGYILTNAHVVQGADRIVVVPPLARSGWPRDQKGSQKLSYRARLVGIHAETDLAVLKIDVEGLPALPLRTSGVTQGELVFAVGAPHGLASTMTMGVVGSASRQLDIDSPFLFIQTDAPINPGNSGGPLVDANGEVVGINTFIISRSGGSDGLGFAVPAHVVRFVYDSLRKRGYVRRAELGLSAQGITPEMAAGLGLPRDTGVVVSDVEPGGPADQAGLRIGDVLDAVDGRRIDILPDLMSALYREGGARLKFAVLRGGSTLNLEVETLQPDRSLQAMAEAANPETHLVRRLGIIALDIDRMVQQRLRLRAGSGVIVLARVLEGPGATSALQPGDAIHAVDGAPIASVDQLKRAAKERDRSEPLVLQIERNGQFRYLTIDLE
jgi:serine protease Do